VSATVGQRLHPECFMFPRSTCIAFCTFLKCCGCREILAGQNSGGALGQLCSQGPTPMALFNYVFLRGCRENNKTLMHRVQNSILCVEFSLCYPGTLKKHHD
jgi:hypothetical protein